MFLKTIFQSVFFRAFYPAIIGKILPELAILFRFFKRSCGLLFNGTLQWLQMSQFNNQTHKLMKTSSNKLYVPVNYLTDRSFQFSVLTRPLLISLLIPPFYYCLSLLPLHFKVKDWDLKRQPAFLTQSSIFIRSYIAFYYRVAP